MYSFSSQTPLSSSCHITLSRLPCAIQQVLSDYLFKIQQCIPVHPKLHSYPFLLATTNQFSKSVSLFLNFFFKPPAYGILSQQPQKTNTVIKLRSSQCPSAWTQLLSVLFKLSVALIGWYLYGICLYIYISIMFIHYFENSFIL